MTSPDSRRRPPLRTAVLVACLSLGLARYASGGPERDSIVDLSGSFGDLQAAFTGFDEATGTTLRYHPVLCSTRFTPASTFKIPNSLIFLETGVVATENDTLQWDGTERPVPAWNMDHTLASAVKNSVVWFFQEYARRVGPERMQRWIDSMDYGNRDISGGIDKFWLGRSLRISPDEQVRFLLRLVHDSLPCSHHSLEVVRRILWRDGGDGWTLRAKTGVADFGADSAVAWYVGWVERPAGRFVFATCLLTGHASRDGQALVDARIPATMRVLRYLHVIR